MRLRTAIPLVLIGALAASVAPAQRSPIGGGTTPIGSTPNSVGSPSARTNGPGPDTSVPVFVSGKVVTSDGSEIPQNASIVRVCGSSRRTVGYLDGKGRFNVRLGGGGTNFGTVGDVSEPGLPNSSSNPGAFGGDPFPRNIPANQVDQTQFIGCELQVSAPGFRSPSIDLSNRRTLDSPDLGTIVIQRIAGIEGTSVSATSFNAPKDAQKAYQRGEQFMQKSKPDLAAKEFEKATELYPKYAAAWLDLGRARVRLQDDNAAGEAFRKAIDADPKLVDSWGELGMVLLRQKNWPEAAQNLDRALHLNPVEFPNLWFFDAVANYNAKNLDAAEKSAREAVRVDTRHENPGAEQILGLILFQKKDYPGSMDALRSYLRYAPDAPDADQVRKQIADLESALAPRQ